MIHIIDDLYLDSDKYQYIVVKDTGRDDKDGNRIYNPLAFKGTIEGSIEWVLKSKQRQLVENNKVELNELLKLCKEENKRMIKILESIKALEKI